MTTLDAASMHRAFLEALFRRAVEVSPPLAKAVRVVARLRHPGVLNPDNDRWLTLFLPDLHLVSPEAAALYDYGFSKLDAGRFVLRDRLLSAVFDAGLDFWREVRPKGRTIATYQLGDFFDLWREGQYTPGVGVDQLVRRILGCVPWLNQKLLQGGSRSLEADVVAGNHDRAIARGGKPLSRAKRAFAPEFGRPNLPRSTLVLHGDVFDPIEGLRDRVSAYFLKRFGRGVSGREYELVSGEVDHLPGSKKPAVLRMAADADSLPDIINVRHVASNASRAKLSRTHEQLAGTQGFFGNFAPKVDGVAAAIEGFRDGSHKAYKRLRKSSNLPVRLPDLRMVVVGHSHHARMVVVGEPDDPASFVLADCGAWIESILWPPATSSGRATLVPSAQIGVLCGDDFRIYQLDPQVTS